MSAPVIASALRWRLAGGSFLALAGYYYATGSAFWRKILSLANNHR
jgi:hypothetical protein